MMRRGRPKIRIIAFTLALAAANGAHAQIISPYASAGEQQAAMTDSEPDGVPRWNDLTGPSRNTAKPEPQTLTSG